LEETKMKKVIHIVVHGGLIQNIYTENVDADDVVIYDLDTTDYEEYAATAEALADLRKTNPERIY
jgi:hypothetical protein